MGKEDLGVRSPCGWETEHLWDFPLQLGLATERDRSEPGREQSRRSRKAKAQEMTRVAGEQPVRLIGIWQLHQTLQAMQGPPPAPSKPGQALLSKARKLLVLALIRYILRNAVKAHHSK